MLEAEVCGAYCRRKRKRWRGQKDRRRKRRREKEEEEEDSGSGVSPSLSRLAVKRTKHNRKRTRRQSGIGDRHISRKSCHGEGRGWPSALNGTAAGFVFRNLLS